MKKLKKIWFNLKWSMIRLLCKIFFRKVVVEQSYLKYQNTKHYGHNSRINSGSPKEGQLHIMQNHLYVSLGDYTSIYARANKFVEMFFRVNQKI